LITKPSKISILAGGKSLLVFVQLFKQILVNVALLLWATLTYAAPQKIVSLNLCTDQLLMLLADPNQIASLSKIVDDPNVSFLAKKAAEFRKNRGDAEEIFMNSPDLVVAGVYTEKATVQILQSLGVRVEIFPIEQNFDDIVENIRKMGLLVGHSDRAKRMINDFNIRLEELRSGITERPRAAIYSANGYTTGTDTMSGQILKTAGFQNITEEVGMSFGGTLPLETLVMLQPDFVITGKAYPGHSRSEEILKHPALRPFKGITQTDAKWICGTPAVLDAVAELQHAHPEKGLR
jgi:iron complex transport system substrate-binding protein